MKKLRRGMNIPKEYPVGGNKISVTFQRGLAEDSSAMGLYMPHSNAIVLQPPQDGVVGKQNVEETFCHEVVHSWLDKMNYRSLFRKEKFVDDMALVLYQFLKEMGVF